MTNTTIGLTDAQQRALSAMGIEVWVRRGAPGVTRPDVPVATSGRRAIAAEGAVRKAADAPATLARATEPSNAAAVAPAGPSDSAHRVELDCLSAPGVVLVGRWHNPLDKRLANDIALAISAVLDAAHPRAAKPQSTRFKWPATQTGDRTIGGARNAFRAFLRGQTERAHAGCVVLFGDAAGALADDVESPRILRQPSIGALRADREAKKALWLSVSQNVPA